jgi:hypothetical protein
MSRRGFATIAMALSLKSKAAVESPLHRAFYCGTIDCCASRLRGLGGMAQLNRRTVACHSAMAVGASKIRMPDGRCSDWRARRCPPARWPDKRWNGCPALRRGNGSRRAKPGRMQRFEQADRVVVEVFADLHEALHFKKQAISQDITRCRATVRAIGARR